MIKTNSLQVEISNRQILKIAIPIAAAVLVPQANFVTNNIFLGQLGESALAVAGITGVYYLVFAVIGFGLNNGLQALISRRAGENRPLEIGELFMQGLFISLSIALLGIVLSYTVGPWLLRQSLHDPVVYQQAVSFLKIRIWGLPFLFVYQMRNALLVGTNNGKYLVTGTIAETIANIVLDYGLIFGNLGLPALGFNGAAVASIAAEFIGMAVVFYVVHRQGIGRQFGLFNSFSFNPRLAKLILVQSSPLILQYGISVISWEFFYILIEHHGMRDLAVSNAMRNILGIFGCFTWAFAATCNSMVANILGQGRESEVMHLVKKIIKLSMGISIIFFLALNFFPHLFLGFYGQGELFVIYAIPVLRIISVALIIMSFSNVLLNAITGTGNTRINLQIEIVAIGLYLAYVWIVLEKLRLPITYGWVSEWLYWLCMFIMSYIYMHGGKWKQKTVE